MPHGTGIFTYHRSTQIIATSHDLTPKGGLVREIPLFQGNLGWWNIIIWPDTFGACGNSRETFEHLDGGNKMGAFDSFPRISLINCLSPYPLTSRRLTGNAQEMGGDDDDDVDDVDVPYWFGVMFRRYVIFFGGGSSKSLQIQVPISELRIAVESVVIFHQHINGQTHASQSLLKFT